jgi:glyoxylase-like metal-dependent hydrolase (beta-lactamase superfamily II)
VGHHYEGDDLIVRKIRVGDMENNTYVLECPATHEALLVDGCFEADVILAASKGARIVGIVQTHGHYDHVEALPALKDELGVPVYAHPAESYPVPVDVELSDGDTISFGKDHEVVVLHTPGHTPGGDTLFPGGPGNTWEDGKLFAQIIDSIESKLFTLPDDTRVYPGHGDDTTIGAEKGNLEEWKERGW